MFDAKPSKYHNLYYFSTMAIFFIMLVSSAMLYLNFQSAVKQARIDAKNTSFIVDKNIETILKKIDISLISLKQILILNSKFEKNSTDSSINAMDFFKRTLPEVYAFRIANADGRVILNTDRDVPVNLSISDRAYFQYHKKNVDSELYVSDPFRSKFNGRMVITLSRRIVSDNKKFSGIIYAVIDLHYLNTAISALDVGPSGSVTMISLKDRTLSYRYPPMEDKVGEKMNLQSSTNDLLASNEASGEWEQTSSLDHKQKTFAIKINRPLNYFIGTGLALEDYLMRWYRTLYVTIFVNFFFIVIFGFAVKRYVISLVLLDQQKSQLSETNRRYAVARIASGVAHEINNPLAVIQGKVELIRRLYSDEKSSPNQIQKMLNDIDLMVTRTSGIVKSLQMLEPLTQNFEGQIYLPTAIDPAIGAIKDRAQLLDIKIQLAEVPKVHINFSEDEFILVMVQLLNNSIDAICENKSDKWIRVSFKEFDQKIQIIMTDSGFGLGKDVVKNLKDPFFTTKEPGKGMGLGLSVVDSIVRSYNGRFYLNEQSQNTEFILELKPSTHSLTIAG